MKTLDDFLDEIEKEEQIISGIPVKFIDPKLIPKAAKIIRILIKQDEHILDFRTSKRMKEISKILNDWDRE